MATIVADDRQVAPGGNADADAGWTSHTILGGNTPNQGFDPISAQGTNSQAMRVSGTGRGGLVHDNGLTTVDYTDLHLFVWAFTLQKYESDALNGVLIGITDDTVGVSNIGAWTAGGLNTNIGNKNNFQSWCVDTHAPFSVTTGTPVALTGALSTFLNWDFTTQNGRISAFIDQISRGTGITLTGGTSGVPGNSVDVATNDDTNGRGMFQNIGGVYFILGKVTIGNAATDVASHFLDKGKVWNFESQHVSATFHKIEFVGQSGVAVQAATFGSEVGTGLTAEGSGGNTFQAAGDVPFRIEAIDPNIAVNLFGCNMVNAVALKEDPWRRVITEDLDGVPVFVDVTRPANDATAVDVNPFPTAAAASGDRFSMGSHERFNHATIDVGTIGAGTYTVSWEYSTGGTVFAALTSITDGTGDFKNLGVNTVTFAIPDNWAKGTVNGVSMYWIRAVHDAGTRTLTTPVIDSMSAGIGGGIRAEQANFKAISGTWTNMDTIRVRNGAILRKLTFVDSTAPAKSAQLDLGAFDPADAVRDITIVGSINGLLLQGTSTATTTFNLKNITLVGQTGSNIRVDFPQAATVIINILENGTTPTIDDVNGTVPSVVNAVIVKVTTKKSSDLTAIQGARVILEADTGGPQPVNAAVTITRAATTATVAHTAHNMANGQKVKIKGADQIEYRGLHVISNVSVNAYDFTVSGTPATPATGTITATGVILDGVTDVNGILQDTGFDFVSNQPVTGKARKSTVSPLFRTIALSGTINSNGLDTSVFLISDE